MVGARGARHCRYYAVAGNIAAAITMFHNQVKLYWYRALRRRSQRTSLDWEAMDRLEARSLPSPRILHPWPNVRFDAKTQARSQVR